MAAADGEKGVELPGPFQNQNSKGGDNAHGRYEERNQEQDAGDGKGFVENPEYALPQLIAVDNIDLVT